jgi:hypothetical protein
LKQTLPVVKKENGELAASEERSKPAMAVAGFTAGFG